MTQNLRDVIDVRGLTATQEGMLYHSISETNTDVFHSQVVSTIPSDMDLERFKSAWATLVDRHEALRTAFFWDGLDKSLQVVRPRAEIPWAATDWSQCEPEEFHRHLDRLLGDDSYRSFDLGKAPLVRMQLVRRPDFDWTWILTFHHVILDGWSLRILMRELSDIYGGLEASLPTPVPPSRYLDWLTTQDMETSRKYWRDRLSNVAGAQRLDMPGFTDYGAGHDRIDVTIADYLVESMRAFATTERVSLSAIITAAWSLVISAMTGASDVVVGITTSGRPAQLDGVENMVGLFLNTLPLVSRADAEMTTAEYIAEVNRRQLDLIEHQHLGLPEIHRLAGIRGSESLFESIVVFENLPPENPLSEGKSFDELEIRERSNFPLALLAIPDERFTLRLVYDRARFSLEAATTLIDAVNTVLNDLLDPRRALSRLRFTSEGATELTGPETAPAVDTVVHQIAEIATNRPTARAVATAKSEVTYGDLWEQVNSLASHYKSEGIGRGDRVGVMVPRSIEMIVAILAVLRAGAAYVPLDPSYPRPHLQGLADTSRLAAVAVSPSVDGVPSQNLLPVHQTESSSGSGPAFPTLDDVAYVIHTSGSTGVPKGVVVTHRNLANSTSARSSFYDMPIKNFLLLSSSSFDSSVAGIFWTLTTGGCLVLPDEGGEMDVDHLGHLLEAREVTHLLALPSLYGVMAAERGRMPEQLACVIVAGEAVEPRVIDQHFGASKARLFNEYGPTEGTVWSTARELRRSSDWRLIGRPVANTSTRIITHTGVEAPRGFGGELIVSGPGVAAGYLANAAATRHSFRLRSKRMWYHTGDRCAINENDELVFLGRIDRQLKIRGYRVEPGEVEAALRANQGVKDAAVTLSTINGNGALVGYVTGDIDTSELISELRARLPHHLVPSRVEIVEELPRLPNGKIDHTNLPKPSQERPGRKAQPTTPTEHTLVAIWEELLALEEVGIDEDFFDLGGDSILAIKMVSQARRQGLGVEPSDAVASPTVRRLAHSVDRAAAEKSSSPRCLVPIRTEGDLTPLVCIHAVNGRILPFRSLANHMSSRQPVYAFTAAGLKGQEPPLDSITEMAERYVRELKQIQPDGPYRLLGECFGGSIGLEMARLLEEKGDVVSQVVVIDGALPWDDVRAVSMAAKVRRAFRDGGAKEVIQGVARRLSRRIRQVRDVRLGDTDARFEVYRQRVFEASLAAFGTFTPTRIEAPIVLIKATEDQRPTGEEHAQPNWANFTSELVEAYVDTDHLSMLREPGVADVARLLAEHE